MLSILAPLSFLVASSLVVLSSISPQLFKQQSLWVILGAVIIAFFMFRDWRTFIKYRWFINGLYLLTVALLILVYFIGPTINQTRGWLVLGPFTFQPVELAKVSLILFLANFFSRKHQSIGHWKTIISSFIYFAIPGFLVALQPDFGSLLILFGIWFGFLMVSGLPLKRLAVAVSVFAIAGFFMWSTVLKDYQRERIIGVFQPNQNALSINYSVNQSKIAIGSAGFFGKGYNQGSQTQLGFLTEPETDFILAALIEEWGWLFGFLVIGAFIYLVFRILKIASWASQNFEKFVCLGAAVSLIWQFFLNVGSVLGISPVIGVTFPFLSYGGSSLLTSFFLIAIINSIARKV